MTIATLRRGGLTRDQKVDQARRLLGERLTTHQVAARMRVSERTVRRWLADPTGEKGQQVYLTACCDRCGGPRAKNSLGLCLPCYRQVPRGPRRPYTGPRCVRCGEHLVEPTGLCGFCTEEQAA